MNINMTFTVYDNNRASILSYLCVFLAEGMAHVLDPLRDAGSRVLRALVEDAIQHVAGFQLAPHQQRLQLADGLRRRGDGRDLLGVLLLQVASVGEGRGGAKLALLWYTKIILTLRITLTFMEYDGF